MPKVWCTSTIELEVMNIVKEYLEDELKKYDGILDGGIHFKYKPKDIRVKVIELNCTDYKNSSSLDNLENCVVNINYQDEDQDLTEEVTEYIYNVLDHAVVRNLYFESIRKEVRKISPYLWLGNNFLEIKNNTIYKNKKHNDRVE